MGCAPSKSGAVDNHTHAASRAVQQMVHVHDAATTPMVESMYDGGPSAGSKAIGSVCAPTAARYKLGVSRDAPRDGAAVRAQGYPDGTIIPRQA